MQRETKKNNIKYDSIPDEDERIGKLVVDAAFAVHTRPGPGMLESVYEVCFCHELNKRDLSVRRQVIVPLVYDGKTFDEDIRVDVFVQDRVICELKAVEKILPLHTAQLLTYLKLTERRLGYLINFNGPLIKHGIKRIVL